MVIDWVTFNLERGDYRATAERDDNSAVRAVGAAPALPVRAPGAHGRRAHRAGERGSAARREVLQHGRVHHRRPPRPRAPARHGRPARLRAVRSLGGRRGRPRRSARGRRGPRPGPRRRQGLLDGQPGVRAGCPRRCPRSSPTTRSCRSTGSGCRSARSAPSAGAWTPPTSATTTSRRTTSDTARRSSSTTTSSAGTALEQMARDDAAAHQGHPRVERRRRHRGGRVAVPARPGRQVHRPAEGPLRHPPRGQGPRRRPTGRRLPRLRLSRERAGDGVAGRPRHRGTPSPARR